MRNIIIPVIIILLLAVFLVFNAAVMMNDTEKLGAVLVDVDRYIEADDYGKAVEKLEEFSALVDEYGSYIRKTVNHSVYDEITVSARRLIPLCEKESESQFLSELEAAKCLVERLRYAEIPWIENII